MRTAQSMRRREPVVITYGSRESPPKVWRRGPKFTIETASPSSLTGDRLMRLHSGPAEQEIACDEDVFAIPNFAVVRVFGVWGPPDAASRPKT